MLDFDADDVPVLFSAPEYQVLLKHRTHDIAALDSPAAAAVMNLLLPPEAITLAARSRKRRHRVNRCDSIHDQVRVKEPNLNISFATTNTRVTRSILLFGAALVADYDMLQSMKSPRLPPAPSSFVTSSNAATCSRNRCRNLPMILNPATKLSNNFRLVQLRKGAKSVAT
jgi:hypothetical protein